MPAYDSGFKIVARTAGRELARLAGLECTAWEPIVGELQTTERLADRAFRAKKGRHEFVVYMEAYTRWDPSAPWNVLAKSGLLSERERLPTVSLVYILTPLGYRSQGGQFRLEVDGLPTQQIWFREICLWEEKPQPWWVKNPGLMPLFPLCLTEKPPEEEISFAAQAIQKQTSDKVIQGDLLATLAIFGRLKYAGLDVLKLIGREAMKESEIMKEFVDEGREEARRADILDALQIRFGSAGAKEFKESLGLLHDLDLLSDIFRLTLKSRRITEFRRGYNELIKKN